MVRDYHPVRAQVTYNVKGAGKRVALTFDDGGPAWVWARMLDTLKTYRMHATFFVIGPYVRAEPRVARRVAREGHGIGSHGWTHSPMTTQGYDGVRRELISSEAPWWRAAKATPVGWLRPPYGDHNGTTVAAAGSVGFKHVVMWDVDPGDWRGYGAAPSPPTRCRTCTPAPSSACTCARTPWPRSRRSCAACAPAATRR